MWTSDGVKAEMEADQTRGVGALQENVEGTAPDMVCFFGVPSHIAYISLLFTPEVRKNDYHSASGGSGARAAGYKPGARIPGMCVEYAFVESGDGMKYQDGNEGSGNGQDAAHGPLV